MQLRGKLPRDCLSRRSRQKINQFFCHFKLKPNCGFERRGFEPSDDESLVILFQNGHWNGLVSELVNKKFDMVLTSLKVNAEREAAVDFTAPFLESGTTILV